MSKDDRRQNRSPVPGGAETHRKSDQLSRRSLLRLGALAGAGATLKGAGSSPSTPAGVIPGSGFAVEEATIAEMRALIDSEQLSAAALTRIYLARIETIDQRQSGPHLKSILEINPEAEQIASQLDDEFRLSGPRGPLHGIPIVLKDNIDTGDSMGTRAGSLALEGAPALMDATVAERLRQAGAVILGKAGLSEWANFRGFDSSSGWSAAGGQVRNPYVVDRNPCGSSSGSAVAVSANLAAAAIGTETDGSIVCPAGACGVVGIKPTTGLTSRAGVIPISPSLDSVGTFGRTVYDAAALLGPLTGPDPRDPATEAGAGQSFVDYTQFVDPNGLAGARIGVDPQLFAPDPETNLIFEAALDAMENAGATLVDVRIPTWPDFANDSSEVVILIYEFKRALNDYLATRVGIPVANLAEIIAFNYANADEELQYFRQQWMELSQNEIFSEEDYLTALQVGPRLAGMDGIDATLAAGEVDALVTPTNTPAWPIDLVNGDAFSFGSSSLAAMAGYPLVTVPAGFIFDLPVGVSFMAGAWSEPTLIRLASGFEAATRVRRAPEFKLSTPLESTQRSRWRYRETVPSSAGSLKRQAQELLRPSISRLRYL